MERAFLVEKDRLVSGLMVAKFGGEAVTYGATHGDPLNTAGIYDWARQGSVFVKNGGKLVVTSSGAVPSGQYLIGTEGKSIREKQLEAAFGQAYLMKTWVDAFAVNGLVAAQFLVTKHDLQSQLPVIMDSLDFGVAVVNEHDTACDEELRKLIFHGDNDEVAKLVALGVGADTLLLLTNVDGVLNHNGQLIKDGIDVDLGSIHGISEKGSGGMFSKASNAREASRFGINAYIGRANHPDIILKVATGEANGLCTFFPSPAREVAKSISLVYR